MIMISKSRFIIWNTLMMVVLIGAILTELLGWSYAENCALLNDLILVALLGFTFNIVAVMQAPKTPIENKTGVE